MPEKQINETSSKDKKEEINIPYIFPSNINLRSIIHHYPTTHLRIPVAMSSDEVEYIAATTAYMRPSHLGMLTYDLSYLGTSRYDKDNLKCQSAKITSDNETAINMAKCNKDTAGKRHVGRRLYYVRQDT